MEAARDRRQAQVIYYDDGLVEGGRLEQRLHQRQQMRRRRIDDVS